MSPTRDNDAPLPEHTRPATTDDATVAAVGKLSEALETVERARGRLYDFHQLTGSADLALGEAVDELRDAGHADLADRIQTELVGRNVIRAGGPSRSSRSTTTGTTRSFVRSSRRPGKTCSTAGGTSTRRR